MSKPNLNYGKLVSTSWQLVKKHPFLWILGILGGYGGGGFGGGGGGGDWSEFSESEDKLSSAKDMAGEVLGATTDNVSRMIEIGGITLLVFVLILFIILLWIISAIFRGGLIKSVTDLSKNKESNFKQAWADGMESWRPLFWLMALLVLVSLIGLLPFAVAFGLAMFETAILTAIAIIFGILWLIVYAAVMIMISFVYPYAEREIVLEGKGVIEGAKGGYKFFRTHWKQALIVFLINIGLGLAYGMAMILVLLIVGLPIFFIIMALAAFSPIAGIFIGVLVGIVVFVGLMVVQGFFGAFVSTIYTGTYLALRDHS